MSGTRRGFAKSISSLDEVFAFLDESLSAFRVSDRARLVLHLAVEELFTNMVKYNSGTSRQIAIEVAADDGHATVELSDPDTDPFDPATADPVDVRAPIEERTRGGLGLHLVRSMVDTFDYHYQDREMKLSITKRLE